MGTMGGLLITFGGLIFLIIFPPVGFVVIVVGLIATVLGFFTDVLTVLTLIKGGKK